jgi:hypothetical protein
MLANIATSEIWKTNSLEPGDCPQRGLSELWLQASSFFFFFRGGAKFRQIGKNNNNNKRLFLFFLTRNRQIRL